MIQDKAPADARLSLEQYCAWKAVREVLGQEAVERWETNNPALARIFNAIYHEGHRKSAGGVNR